MHVELTLYQHSMDIRLVFEKICDLNNGWFEMTVWSVFTKDLELFADLL